MEPSSKPWTKWTVLKDEEPGDGLYGWTAPRQYKSQKGNSMGPQLMVGPSVRTSGRRDCTIDTGGSASVEQEVIGQRCRQCGWEPAGSPAGPGRNLAARSGVGFRSQWAQKSSLLSQNCLVCSKISCRVSYLSFRLQEWHGARHQHHHPP